MVEQRNSRIREEEEEEEEEEGREISFIIKIRDEELWRDWLSRRKRNVPSSIVFVVRIRAKPKHVGIGDTSGHLDFHRLYLLRHFCG